MGGFSAGPKGALGPTVTKNEIFPMQKSMVLIDKALQKNEKI